MKFYNKIRFFSRFCLVFAILLFTLVGFQSLLESDVVTLFFCVVGIFALVIPQYYLVFLVEKQKQCNDDNLRKAGNAIIDMISENDLEKSGHKKLPSFTAAIAGPLLVILLLALRPLFQIAIDPLIALPAGGILCMLATGQIKNIKSYTEFGLSKVIGVSILLIGTGTLAGIIKASNLQFDMISLLEAGNLPAFLLAPISGILMAGATASTTAGATIASQTFASTLISSGVDAVSAGAMVHSGATVIDSMPHGSFFHATGGSVNMQMKERMKLIPYEACVGLASTILSTILYLV